MAGKPRAIFFGTPAFAVPCLEALIGVADVALVVCQPDRPSGRGLKLTPPPVKLAARSHGIAVVQPKRVRTATFSEELRALDADVGVVVAYGRILPAGVLSAPRLGSVNVHASLLPKLRGAAPIQWSIVRGDRETGVCLMQMDEGMDTGPELARRVVSIGPDETAGELSERLAGCGGELVSVELPRFVRGELEAVPQDHGAATMAPMLKKEDGLVRFDQPAPVVHNLVRGMSPWPGAFAFLDGKRVKLHRSRLLVAEGQSGEPGTVVRADRHGVEVACAAGTVAFDVLQPEGRKRLSAEQFVAGQRLRAGARFATSGT